ncbi:hypothetical protein ABMA27_003729 [Loxostege sticticalis]|uniref:Ionotropic receptor n=1 Tax=Loxostege sticticalis TaxID=481309 RepID=A0ABR3HQ46_LOXSC
MSDNKSVVVSTMYNCEEKDDLTTMIYNPAWRHNMIGCFLIEIIKSMYGLNVTYIIEPPDASHLNISRYVDLYALPFALSPQILKLAHPIQAVVNARYGFLVRRPHDIGLLNHYYSRPFTFNLWKFLFVVAVVVCAMFFLAAWWEKRLLGGLVECSIGLEMLLIVGGYCQHCPPVEAIFCSRRTAYFTFFLYSYIIYTVYTSNLLSHLVSDKENDIGLDYLEYGCFEFAVLENMKHLLSIDFEDNADSAIYKRLSAAETLKITPGLSALRWNRTALLSDYITVYPRIRAEFNDDEICELVEVDLNTDVRKYIFASRRFKYREKLKIGTLKAKESGILKKLTYYDHYHPLECETILHADVKIQHIFIPLLILAATYVVSFIIMLLERLHFRETKLWPYVN